MIIRSLYIICYYVIQPPEEFSARDAFLSFAGLLLLLLLLLLPFTTNNNNDNNNNNNNIIIVITLYYIVLDYSTLNCSIACYAQSTY